MIIKKQVYQPNKKANPLLGMLLFIISMVLLLITGPIGFIYGVVYTLITKGLKGLGTYLLKIAISIDQLGNVLMQHLLNLLWVKKGGYPFGNRDETISSALGRNRKLKSLTAFGRGIDAFLDVIDPNHSLNSIDYYIEPSEVILDRLAYVLIEDQRILLVRPRGKDTFEIPGALRAVAESDAKALVRGVSQVLGIMPDLSSLLFIGIFEGRAANQKPGIILRQTCYTATYEGTITPRKDVAELQWLQYEDRPRVSETDQLIFDYLQAKGQLE